MPHQRGTSLAEEIDTFARAWRAYNSGRKADGRISKEETLGHIVGREVTFGDNGWHYHHHVLRFDRDGAFRDELFQADWLAALEIVGRNTAAAKRRAYHCAAVGDQAHAAYVAKLATSVDAETRCGIRGKREGESREQYREFIGSEIASAATKGRNLATLLQDALRADTERERREAAATWASGVRDICDRKVASVRWSPCLGNKVGLPRQKSDKQAAAEEVLPSDEFLGGLTATQWRGVLLHRAEFALLCAANQGADAVNSFLAGLELGQLNDEARPAVVVPLQAEICYSKAGLSADVLARMEKLKNESGI